MIVIAVMDVCVLRYNYKATKSLETLRLKVAQKQNPLIQDSEV